MENTNLKKTEYQSYLYVFVQAVLFVIYFLLPKRYIIALPDSLIYTGIAIAVMGGLVITIASINLGKSISPFPKPLPSAQLITGGIFKHIRHPIYTGFILLFIGLAIADENLLKFLFVGAFILFFYFKATFEEQQLNEKFTNYREYMNKTGKFIPKL